MYVRDARNRDEAWLLERIEKLGLSDVAFRSRDYVLAVDESTDERAGFGRLRVHDDACCELTGIGVLPAWRGQGVGAHVVERLVEEAGDEGFEVVYALTDQPGYLAQFGFESTSEDALPDPLVDRLAEVRERREADVTPTVLAVDEFEMPDRLREAFKTATPDGTDDRGDGGSDDAASPEEFGIDPEDATYKYDTGK